jgi:WD40 repeat protein
MLCKNKVFNVIVSILPLLLNAQSPVRSVQSVHGPAERMCFTPDGKKLVTGHEYEAMIVWNAQTGYKIEEYLGFNNPLTSVACSRDGRFIAAAGGDSITRLFDGRNYLPLRDLKGHNHWIYFLQFTKDSKHLLSASTDMNIIKWDPESGKEIMKFKGHEQWIWVIELSPDGKFMVSGAAEEEMFMWDIESGKVIRKFYGHKNGIFGLAFSPDGKTLASASWDGSVRIWNPETGNETKIIKTDELNDCIKFSPDGKWLILGMKTGFIHIYNTKTWERFRRFSAHSKGVEDLAFWGGNGSDKYLVTCGDDGYVKWWDFSLLIKGKPGIDG